MLAEKIDAPRPTSDCSPALSSLSWREQQIADLVCRRGLATARELEAPLGGSVTNATIRSTLVRLVAKRILTRVESGAGRGFLYAPATTLSTLRDQKLEECASEFFDDSLECLSQVLAHVWATIRESPRPWIHSSEWWQAHRASIGDEICVSEASGARVSTRQVALEQCALDFYEDSLPKLAEALSQRRGTTRLSIVGAGTTTDVAASGREPWPLARRSKPRRTVVGRRARALGQPRAPHPDGSPPLQ